jgi:mutator protein MutT
MIKVVTALIKNPEGKVLLQRRAPHRQFGGRLETPGGKANPDEDLRVALTRELAEELDLANVIVGPKVYTCEFVDYDPQFTVYFFEVSIGNQVPVAKEDATDLGWYFLADLDWSECVPSLEGYLLHKDVYG